MSNSFGRLFRWPSGAKPAQATNVLVPLPDRPMGEPIHDYDILITRNYVNPMPSAGKNESTGKNANRWDPPAFIQLEQWELLKLFHQCKLDHAYSIDPKNENTFFEQKDKAAVLKNLNLHGVVTKPKPTSYYRSASSHQTKFESFQLNASVNLPISTVCGDISSKVKIGVDATKKKVVESDEVCATVNYVCAYARVNLKNCLALRTEVVDRLKEAVAFSSSLLERYVRLMEVGEDVGFVLIEECDIGVRADSKYIGKVTKNMVQGGFNANFEAAAKAKFGTKAEKEDIKEWNSLSFSVAGPYADCESVSDIRAYAGDIRNYDTVTIRRVTTIFDVIAKDSPENRDLHEKVAQAMKWAKYWSDLGKHGYWENVTVLKPDWYSVWYEPQKCCILCEQFSSGMDAKQFYERQNGAKCLVYYYAGEKPYYKESYEPMLRKGALERIRKTVTDSFQHQEDADYSVVATPSPRAIPHIPKRQGKRSVNTRSGPSA